jgi:uncharacterized membrane protein YeaQ/YmgE (transglycosylase-associated protein family)
MWLLIGFIGMLVGAVSFYLVPANYRGGIIGTMLVGIFAALFGAIMAQRIGILTQSSGGFAGLFFAVLVLVGWRAISKPIER